MGIEHSKETKIIRNREIGSDFWDVPLTERDNGLFPKETQWYLSGRTALQAVLKELKEIRSVAVPSWCCHTMIEPFIKTGIEVHYYPVYWENGLIQEIDHDRDALLIMDYFGYSGNQADIEDYNGTVIRDVTHSIFSCTYNDADYYFGSLRKWCGVWTGGYAWTKDGHRLDNGKEDTSGYASLRETAMLKKAAFINNLVENNEKSYLQIFADAEELLETACIRKAEERDVLAARRLDAEGIKEKRRANASALRLAFPEWLVFADLNEEDCPMFVPVIIPHGKRDELRRRLIEKGIYCPVHWPMSKYHKLSKRERQIYDNELSLVCDQRYDAADMNRIIESIREIWSILTQN